MTNPLLTSFLLPPFSSIRPEHVVPAVKEALKHCYKIINGIEKQSLPFTWNNLCQPLADAEDRLSRIWSPVRHLNAVNDSQELRAAYEKSLPLLSEYSTWSGQNNSLYRAYLSLRHSQDYIKLSISQKKAVDNALRDFELSGIGLPAEGKQRYAQIFIRLSELGSLYSNNILDSTMAWSKLIINEQTLYGMPKTALATARSQAAIRNQQGWLITLDTPSYVSVLAYCDNAALREEIYRAYNTRASDQEGGEAQWNNGPIMDEILVLRHELAQLLGFESYADKSMVTKMAKNPQQVFNFLTDLALRARSQGVEEFKQLRAFALNHFGCTTMEPWDISYYAEKQKKYLFSINDEQLRPYFPEHRVIGGLFEVVKRVYGIVAKERINVETWHPDVRFFDLFNEDGELRGSFYLDLYSRENKRSGAWMDDCIGMMRKGNGELQKPVAYLTCNFNRPIIGHLPLFTHNDVTTLFHEFGHNLHHILTCIETSGVAGISGVPWDAVELPSQLMENYCWHPEALVLISGHYETGKPLPENLLKSLLEVKKYNAGLFILRQLELGLFDLYIHDRRYQSRKNQSVLEVLEEVQKNVAVIPTPSWCRSPHAFSHIFSGGYAAGYYSYLWADVLAADAWSRFEKEGIFNRNTGESFLETILSRGGSEEPMALFVRFRSRLPKLDAMLRRYGIIEKT